ncbi:MAG: hypothetical protein EON87_10625 [Brevundimonas sp.]|nr:MAG: hypothetical protein EON87_10625 [Brevundimonas sp.]
MPEFHLPRLRPLGVITLLNSQDGLNLPNWQDRGAAVARWTSWGALGARRATETELQAIRDKVLTEARRFGFPASLAQGDRRRFDAAAAVVLLEPALIPEEEGLRDDVWSWIATVLVPDVTVWRFSHAEARFRGGARNTFQRLWMRGAALDRGSVEHRWTLLETLPEDAQVQIFERPGLSGSLRVARAIAEGWARAQAAAGGRNLEDVTRRAILALRASNQVLSLDALDDTRLALEIDRRFSAAMAASAPAG